MIWAFANGLDTLPVSRSGSRRIIKTIGNSTTAPRDLITDDDIKITLYILSESVAERLRKEQFYCRGVQIKIRDNQLFSYERQGRLQNSTCISHDIFQKAYELFLRNKPKNPVRSLGVRAIQRGIMLLDTVLSKLDPVAEHTIYPEAFLKSKT